MRKHAKSGLMKFLLLLIIIVFIGYFGSLQDSDITQSIATVGDKSISHSDFQRQYNELLQMYRRQYKENLTEETLKNLNLKEAALNNLINQAVILQKAKTLGISVSTEELQNAIISFPAFQRNGVFDQRAYQLILRDLQMSPEDFEKGQKTSLTAAKLESLIRESVKVSDAEAFELYRIQHETTDISFIKIQCSTFRERVKPSDEALQKFLSEQKELYRVPERIQIKYLLFRGEDYADAVNVSDQELREFFDRHGNSLQKKEDEQVSFADVKDKILATIRHSKASELAQAEAKKARIIVYEVENLEAYAGKNNLTVHSPESFTKDNIPPELSSIQDLMQQLSNLKPNQFTPILSSPQGFFIMQLFAKNASSIPKLSEIRDEVEKHYIKAESQILCRKEADDVLDRLKKGAAMTEVAREKNLSTDHTGFFTPGTAIPKIGPSHDIGMAIYQLSENNPLAEQPFLVDNQYFIIGFKDRILEEKDFETNKDSLRQFLTQVKENLYFQSWIEASREAMKATGKIKISEDVDKL